MLCRLIRFFLLLLTLYKPSNSPARDDEDLSSKENDDLIEIFLFKLTLIILTIFFLFFINSSTE